MTLKLLATDGMTVISSDPTVICTIIVDPTGITKVSAVGALVHVDGDTIKVSAITVPSAGATTPDPATYTVGLVSTATKVKAEGTLVLRQDDESELINATPKIPGSPPVDYPVAFKCKISVAGQTKVKGV